MVVNTQTVALFNQTAWRFTQQIDTLIAQGAYTRGRLFERLVRDHCTAGVAILDYGCGPGRIAHALARNGFHVLGVDCSAEMIRQAKLQVTVDIDLRFRSLGTPWEIFEPDTYGGIVCSSVIEFVNDPDELLRSFWKALVPGGAVIISYAHSGSIWRRYVEYHRDRHPHLRVQRHVWSWSQARKIFTGAGFEVVEGPRYFESPFDNHRFLKYLSTLSVFGTLGLVVLRRPSL